MILTTMQAASLMINSRDFRFGLHVPEIQIIERNASKALLAEIDKAGFVVTYDATRHGYNLCTRKGTIPSFCEAGGFLAMDEARRIFSKS